MLYTDSLRVGLPGDHLVFNSNRGNWLTSVRRGESAHLYSFLLKIDFFGLATWS